MKTKSGWLVLSYRAALLLSVTFLLGGHCGMEERGTDPAIADKLRENGWQVPAYTMPPKVDDLAVLRIVVREGFSRGHPALRIAARLQSEAAQEDRQGPQDLLRVKSPADQIPCVSVLGGAE